MGDAVAQIFNATGSAITQVLVDNKAAPVKAVPAFAANPDPGGSWPMSACSLSLAGGQSHLLTLQFESTQQCSASVSVPGTASALIYVFAFFNGMVVTRSDGTATELAFQHTTTTCVDATGVEP